MNTTTYTNKQGNEVRLDDYGTALHVTVTQTHGNGVRRMNERQWAAQITVAARRALGDQYGPYVSGGGGWEPPSADGTQRERRTLIYGKSSDNGQERRSKQWTQT